MALQGDPRSWDVTTKQGAIWAAMGDIPSHSHIPGVVRDASGRKALRCQCCQTTYNRLVPALGIDPLVFRTNDGAELPQGSKRADRLRNLIGEIHAYGMDYRPEAPKAKPAAALTDPAPSATPKVDAACQRDAEHLIGWIQGTWRPWATGRNADGKAFDQVGLRPAMNAARMLTQGISVPAIKHALTLHYPPEARRHLGVESFDATTFAKRDWKGVVRPSSIASHDGTHKALPYIRALADARLPICLVGPPGTGKTTLAEHLADAMFGKNSGKFGFVSMTRGTSPSAFNGRPKLASDGTAEIVAALIANGRAAEALEIAEARYQQGDSVLSQFARIYGEGGVFLFDEMDAAEPNLLLLVNAAMANGHFSNPTTGEIVERHPDFIPVAGMNTLGLGGDRSMVGREKQDAAALDRWNAGRTEILLDESLESHIYWSAVAA